MRILISILVTALLATVAIASSFTESVESYILSKHKMASKVTSIKKTLKVYVVFNHDKSTKVIHDPEIAAMAKKQGIKKLEFHDWSGFSKGYIVSDI